MARRPPGERKLRRCNLWDDKKRPRRTKRGDVGCFRSDADCHFVHPTEKEWDTAERSIPPRLDDVVDNERDFYYEAVDGHRTQSFSSDSHRDRRLDTSPHKSPRGRPRSRSRRSRSPVSSVAESDQLEKLRQDDAYLLRGPSYSRRHTRVDDRERSRSRRDRNYSPVRRSSPSRSRMPTTKPAMHPPPIPQAPLPARPPPSVPTAPSFLSPDLPQNPPAKSRSLTVEELRKLWHERVDLMFTSINVHQQYSEAEQKLRSWRQLGASSRKASLSTEDEARMAAKTLDMETAYENKKKEIFDVITKLTASDYWPAVKPPDLQSLETKFSSMKNYVSELRDSVNDLNANFSTLLKSKDKDSGAAPNDSGTTSNDSGEPPLKRRRLEGEDATADTSEIALPSGALEEIQERLTSVACQLSDLQNDIYQRDAIIEDEIEARIDARLEEVDIFSDEDMNPSSDMVTAAVQAETAKGLEMVRVTNEQLGEVVQEVANLMVQSKGNDDEATQIRQENERLKAEITQLKASAEADAKLVQQNKEEVEALATAFQAFIAQTPPPPKLVIPTTSYLMEELDEVIFSSVSKHIKHILENIRNEVSSMLQADSASMYENLWPKIELILRMVDKVARITDVHAAAHG